MLRVCVFAAYVNIFSAWQEGLLCWQQDKACNFDRGRFLHVAWKWRRRRNSIPGVWAMWLQSWNFWTQSCCRCLWLQILLRKSLNCWQHSASVSVTVVIDKDWVKASWAAFAFVLIQTWSQWFTVKTGNSSHCASSPTNAALCMASPILNWPTMRFSRKCIPQFLGSSAGLSLWKIDGSWAMGLIPFMSWNQK